MTERYTGRTTRMLQQALDLHDSVGQLPVLILGASQKHAYRLAHAFCKMATQNGVNTARTLLSVILDKEAHYEFGVYPSDIDVGDSYRYAGKDYSYIFIDHFAESEEV